MPSKDKKQYPSIILFTGAGANCPLGLPTTKQLFNWIYEGKIRVSEEDLFLDISKYEFVEDIEHIWHAVTLIEKTDKDYRKNGWLLDKLAVNINGSMATWDEFTRRIKILRTDIEKMLFSVYSLKDDKVEDAVKLCEPIISTITHLNYKKSEKNAKNKSKESTVLEAPIFTTNYDRVIEEVHEYFFENNDYNFIDGFRETGTRRILDISKFKESRVNPTIKLFALHGSLKWRKGHRTQKGKRKEIVVKRTDETEPSACRQYKDPILIYPGEKLIDNEYPFNKLYGLFDEYINNATVCIIIGCSFRDKKIRDIITKALSNNNLYVIVISPHADKNCRKLMESKYLEKNEEDIEKIFSYNTNFEEFNIEDLEKLLRHLLFEKTK